MIKKKYIYVGCFVRWCYNLGWRWCVFFEYNWDALLGGVIGFWFRVEGLGFRVLRGALLDQEVLYLIKGGFT